MTTEKNIKDLFNSTAYDRNGDKLGDVKEVYVDDNSGQPTFVEVGHGLFGMGSSLVPMRGHRFEGSNLNLAFSKDRIKDAPDLGKDNVLTPSDQKRIYEHYELSDTQDTERYRRDGRDGLHDDRHREAGMGAGAGAGLTADRDLDRDRDFDRDRTADDAVVRSEERLNVDKERVETGEVRLRKHVVTDTETVEVPVTREEVRIEREPITRDEARHMNTDLGDDEASVTLHEERVNIQKETVPVEKVGLAKDKIRETETHTEELRKEQIETEGVDGLDRHNGRRDDRI
ncbi:PRC and DUF2382 domain-containing protein [Corynebacterium sp. H78]|uniref:PRC and DUF2382 domain-containing protein n=1 Tax=Corynebacterium sp. H78 TaxID=3133417 RepID=UPI0030A1F914